MADARRQELATFLRSRRERVTPADVGLPSSGRRRTPGLRREEVALIAGVGVTWYTWLEQGRQINASEQVLTAVAKALKLDPDEHNHLLGLAGFAVPPSEVRCVAVTPDHLTIMRQLLPLPACIQTTRFDVIAYNRTYRHLINDIEQFPVADRNCAVLNFLDPAWGEAYEEHEDVSANMVARLRSRLADHLDDPHWTSLVDRLLRDSPHFAELWHRYEVLRVDNHEKGFRNPYVGLLQLRFNTLWLDESRTVALTTTVPVNERTRRRLVELDLRVANDPPVSSRGTQSAAA